MTDNDGVDSEGNSEDGHGSGQAGTFRTPSMEEQMLQGLTGSLENVLNSFQAQILLHESRDSAVLQRHVSNIARSTPKMAPLLR